MTSNSNEMEQLRYFSTAARLANNERISAVEERWMRGYLDRYAPPQVAEPGFPERPSGDARDRNNLRRTNWFNGRYLTAEALSRQDVYFDHRARLNAQALMPGIAWGLGIEGVGINRLRGWERRGGLAAGAPLTLRRGLAFDGVGRPILVSQDFRFTLADLIGVSLKTPRRVVGGQREFMPCICLAPDPGGASGGSAALPSGPYLLVIEAGEVPEGKARVTGDVCGGRRSATCEADVWQGSFGLSLVRFPVDAPLLNDIPDVWALRGTLSAYYFDVFEHPLWKRWDSPFPIDGSFGRGSGPGRHEGMAIPLALVHLGEDGTALYLDAWIPRRVIAATPGEDWHRTRFGAPPRAAAWARIHQFQTMLQESLAQLPMDSSGEAPRDLHSRGFRHIPPIGFLPVSAPTTVEQVKQSLCTNFSTMSPNDSAPNPFKGEQATFTVHPFLGEIPEFNKIGMSNGATGLILSANDRQRYTYIRFDQPTDRVDLVLQVNVAGSPGERAQTRVWLRGSNDKETGQPTVLAEVQVQKSNQKETITLNGKGGQEIMIANSHETVLQLCAFECSVCSPVSESVHQTLSQAEAYFLNTNVVLYGVVSLHDDDIMEDLHSVIDKDPIQLEQSQWNGYELFKSNLANQVKERPGLEFMAFGTYSLLAFVSQLAINASKSELDDLVNRKIEVAKLVVPLEGKARLFPLMDTLPSKPERQDPSWPRSSVVYVKQRMVLLDVLFLIVENLQKSGFDWIISKDVPNLNASYAKKTTADYALAMRTQGIGNQLLIRTALPHPLVRELVLRTMAATMPSLARGDRAQVFIDQVNLAMGALPSSAADSQERQAIALGQVADAWAAEFPEAQMLQLLAAVQPPRQTLDLLERLGALPAPSAGPTVTDSLNLQPPPVRFTTNTSRLLYAEVRQRLLERSLKELMPDLPPTELAASLKVGDLLARSPQEAATLLGGADKLESVRNAFLKDRKDALESAAGLADGAPPEVVAKVETALAAGEQPAEALNRLKAEEEAKPVQDRDTELLRKLGNAETLLRVSGNRIDALAALRRQPEG
jgi:hypothetical protein